MKGVIVAAARGHAICMAPHMRAVEVREIRDSHDVDPLAMLLHELEHSISAWSWIVDGQVACMFGVVLRSLVDDSAYPWFLTTPLVEKNTMQFARACKWLLPELLAVHPKLSGMVDSRHKLSVRWLRWLGAEIGEPEPWGMRGAAFRRFQIGK